MNLYVTSPQENHTELYLSSQIPYIYPDSQPEPGSASMGMRSGQQTFLSRAPHGSSLLSVGPSGSLVTDHLTGNEEMCQGQDIEQCALFAGLWCGRMLLTPMEI